MNVNDYLMSQRDLTDPEVTSDYSFPLAKRVFCKDGFSVSIQATHGAYCTPRRNVGPWWEVELGFPSAEPTPEIMRYAEDASHPTQTVYGYVPVELVDALIELHGGMVKP